MKIKKEVKIDRAVKILSIIIMLTGFIVILGWIFDVSLITNILSNAPSMKFVTAIAFVFTGVIIYYLNEYQKGNILTASVIVPFFTSMTLILMSYSLVSDFIGLHPVIDNMFTRYDKEFLVLPSLLTVFNFLLISFAAMMLIFNKPSYKRWFKIIGYFIMLIGATAVLGFIFNNPIMYCLIEDFCNGMAIHSAILFIISSISLILLTKY